MQPKLQLLDAIRWHFTQGPWDALVLLQLSAGQCRKDLSLQILYYTFAHTKSPVFAVYPGKDFQENLENFVL